MILCMQLRAYSAFAQDSPRQILNNPPWSITDRMALGNDAISQTYDAFEYEQSETCGHCYRCSAFGNNNSKEGCYLKEIKMFSSARKIKINKHHNLVYYLLH